MWGLQQILAEITGLPGVSCSPRPGSQGELTGLMLMRAYFADRGEGGQRDTIITADTAQGTNPASVTMAGYKLEKVATDARGNLDLDDLRARVTERTAGLMLTNPSTLGSSTRASRTSPRSSTTQVRSSTTTAPPRRCGREVPAGRHGLRHRPLSTCTRLLAAAWRRRPGWRAGRRPRDDRAVPALATAGPRRRRLPARPRSPEVDRPRAGLCRPVRRLRPLVRNLHAAYGRSRARR